MVERALSLPLHRLLVSGRRGGVAPGRGGALPERECGDNALPKVREAGRPQQTRCVADLGFCPSAGSSKRNGTEGTRSGDGQHSSRTVVIAGGSLRRIGCQRGPVPT